MKSKNLIGIILSLICIIHCLAIPLTVLIIGIDSLTSFTYQDDMIHEILFIMVFLIYIIVFPKSYKNNKDINTLLIASIGVLSLFSGLFQKENMAIFLTVFGALLILVAHYKNYKLETIN
jgi:hypothetical protein